MGVEDKKRKRAYMAKLAQWDRNEFVAMCTAATLMGVPRETLDLFRSRPLRWRYNRREVLQGIIDAAIARGETSTMNMLVMRVPK